MTRTEHAYRIFHGLAPVDPPPRFHAGPYRGLDTITSAHVWVEPRDGTTHVATIEIYRRPVGSVHVKTVTPSQTWEDTFASLTQWMQYQFDGCLGGPGSPAGEQR